MTATLDTFVYQGSTYMLHIVYKRMRRIIFRIDQQKIVISAPKRTTDKAIRQALVKVMPRLLILPKPQQFIDANGMYYDGVYQPWSALPHQLQVEPFALEQAIKLTLQTMVLPRVHYFENIMAIPLHYRIRIRKLKSRLASNARHHHTLTFASKLIHFSAPLRDAIIIHELAHHFVMNHQQAFYDVVYRYCPNYDTLRGKIKRGQVQ